MMISSTGNRDAFVWIWLPGATDPVVCGRVACRQPGADAVHDFVYGRSYRQRDEAIPLLPDNMPLTRDPVTTTRGLHGVLRDAAPDAWGRKVLLHRLQMNPERADRELTEIDYLLGGGDGPGALHFQSEADHHQPEARQTASLEALSRAAEHVEQGEPLPEELDLALLHGTSVGGARPKALLDDSGKARIAKFSSSSDTQPMVRLEHLGLWLARRCGIDTVDFERRSTLGKDVLLVNRFDRESHTHGTVRKHFFSALTALGLDEMEARYASYPELADYLRRFAVEPETACHELFRRMLFNILAGNTDDHARNHALFWDGNRVQLTPAYDVCIMPRTGQQASQAMTVGEAGSHASLVNALSLAGRFGVSRQRARHMAETMRETIKDNWQQGCEQAGLSEQTAGWLLGRAVLSPVVWNLPTDHSDEI